MTLCSINDIACFVDGCSLLGVGGGGRADEGFTGLKVAFETTGPITWTDADFIADDATALCTFLMGSSAPATAERERTLEAHGLTQLTCPNNLTDAVREWEEWTGRHADVIVPLEVGGANMPLPIAAAHLLGRVAVDADYAGRAIPEIYQTTLVLEDVSFPPGTSVDKFGNVAYIRHTVNLQVAERMGKELSRAAFGSTGLAGFAMTGRQLKRLAVRGTATRSLAWGSVLRQAREKPGALRSVMERAGARFLFSGEVTRKEAGEKNGYYEGLTHFRGAGECHGQDARVFFRNENHILWNGERVTATSPDTICCIERETVKPARNADIAEGMLLEIYGIPCDPALRDPVIGRLLSPAHFGFDFDPVPVT
jgi:DUF917 family protein